jgi:hypothetical protein
MTQLDHIREAVADGLFDAENWNDIPHEWYAELKAAGEIEPTDADLWAAFDMCCEWEIEREKDKHRLAELKRKYENGLTWPEAIRNAHKRIVLKWIESQNQPASLSA